jgi:transcription antitermination factor NusG
MLIVTAGLLFGVIPNLGNIWQFGEKNSLGNEPNLVESDAGFDIGDSVWIVDEPFSYFKGVVESVIEDERKFLIRVATSRTDEQIEFEVHQIRKG